MIEHVRQLSLEQCLSDNDRLSWEYDQLMLGAMKAALKNIHGIKRLIQQRRMQKDIDRLQIASTAAADYARGNLLDATIAVERAGEDYLAWLGSRDKPTIPEQAQPSRELPAERPIENQ